MRGRHLDDEMVRSSFERRARGFPAPRLFERIIHATGRAQRGPVMALVAEPIARPSQVRRMALLAGAPLTVLLLAVLIAGQRSPLLVGASVGAGTPTSAAIVDDDEGEADDDETEGSAQDEADEADEAEDGTDGDETEDDD